LSGTAFHLDAFTKFEGDVFVDEQRKKVDWFGGSPQSSVTGGVPGVIKLTYDQYNELVLDPSLTGGRSLLFTGVDGGSSPGYVNMGAQASLEVDNTVTIEAWIKPVGVEGGRKSGGMFLNKEGEYEIWRAADGLIYWAIANSSPGWRSIPTYYRADENEWVHVALTYDGTNIKTYINGNLFHGFVGGGAIGDFPSHANQDELRVGARQASNSHFAGFVD